MSVSKKISNTPTGVYSKLPEDFVFNGILERISDAFIALDHEWRYTYMNKKAGEIFNRDPHQMSGKHIWTEFPKLVGGPFYEACQKAMEQQHYVHLEEYFLPDDVWLESNIYPSPGGLSVFFLDITENKNAAKRILQSERRYQMLAETSPVGIFHTDATGYTTYVNQRWCQISGMSREEALGDGWLNAVHKDDREKLSRGWQAATKIEDISLSEYRFVRPNGTIAWVIGQAIPERNAENKIVGYVGTTTDITERKKAEQAIAASEEKYRNLVEQASDAIFLFNYKGEFLDVNTAAVKLSGYSREELLQQTIHDLTLPDEVKANPFMYTGLQTGNTIVNERKYIRKDGIILDVEISTKLLTDGRFQSIARDITDRKKAEKQIIREKNLADSVINSMPGLFYLYDQKGKFLRWNKNFETISGYDSSEIESMHPLDFFCEEEKPLLKDKIAKVFEEGMADVEACLYTKSKEKIDYYFNGWEVLYEGKLCLIGVGIDITGLKKAEREIKEASVQLRKLTAHLQNIRDEERKRIGREIHDELGQQLTAIKMDVAWIDKKIPEESAAIKKKLNNIITLLDTGNLSIRKILHELRADVLDTHGLKNALEWQANQFTASTGIPVLFNPSDNILETAEPVANCIFRVFQEALTNITKYARATKVVSALYYNDAHIVLEIADDGKGFDMSLLKNSHTFGILGIRERVTSLNGKFDLVSLPGKGTKIVISIPV